jgi:hypothetical protein
MMQLLYGYLAPCIAPLWTDQSNQVTILISPLHAALRHGTGAHAQATPGELAEVADAIPHFSQPVEAPAITNKVW